MEIEEQVLIETYWNVKIFGVLPSLPAARVLIETYWNVKDCYGRIETGRGTRINRNILECKDLIDDQVDMPGSVLIETYWNVKTIDVSLVVIRVEY